MQTNCRSTTFATALGFLIATAACSSNGASTGADAAALTDEQIVGIVTTANAGEVAIAQIASSTSKTPMITAAAAMMISMHGQLNSELMTVSQTDDLPAASSAIEDQLSSGGAQESTTLKSLTGAAFDAEYVSWNVQAHQGAQQLFQTQLIPSAQSADLQAFLQKMLPVVESHLQMWQSLQAQLGDGGAGAAMGDAGM